MPLAHGLCERIRNPGAEPHHGGFLNAQLLSDGVGSPRTDPADITRQPIAPPFVEIPTVNGMTRCTSTAFSAFPNLITPVAATGMPFLLAWPIDVQNTLFEWVTFCVDWGDGPSPVTAPEWQARLSGFDLTMEEDTRNMAPMQKSLNSPGLSGMPVSYQERRIWNCAEQLDLMIGPERIPPELRVPQLLGPYVER